MATCTLKDNSPCIRNEMLQRCIPSGHLNARCQRLKSTVAKEKYTETLEKELYQYYFKAKYGATMRHTQLIDYDIPNTPQFLETDEPDEYL